jgi:simple sugar transport system permease protein
MPISPNVTVWKDYSEDPAKIKRSSHGATRKMFVLPGVLNGTPAVTTTMSPGFGYAGIVVAMLAALHPAGVVASAIFVATVFVGADAMSRATGVPSFIADVIVALCLLTMLVALLFTTYRVRR